MSLGTVLKTIGADIAKEEEKIFNGTVNELETVVLPVVVEVTNAVKVVLDGDTTDIIGAIVVQLTGLKGAAADEDSVRTAVDTIVPKLQLAQSILTAAPGTNSNAILVQIVQLLKVSPAETQTAFWIEFSGLVATALSTKLSIADAVVIVQWFYKNLPTAGSTTQPAPVPVLN